MKKKLIFLCGARDFHAMDWYKSAKLLLKNVDIIILTDLIEAEGYKKLITSQDKVVNLFILDKILFRKQSKIAHIWRNILKIIFFPFQVILIKKFSKKNPNAIYYAHSMYYLFLGWAAKIPYIGTPQGSDILIKPYKSYLYKYFAIKSLKSAKAVTVDSLKMQSRIKELSGVNAYIIQNGINLETILPIVEKGQNIDRNKILSIRGLSPLYRIKEILIARNSSLINHDSPITLIYPFYENEYLKELKPFLKKQDMDLNKVEREDMYELLLSSKLVISIPVSDSSPRSVYESIFCGSAVAITYHPYYDSLPECMKSRIILIDLKENNWFDKAVLQAEKIISTPFLPSIEALNLFDQKKSFKLIEQIFLNL